MNCYNPIKGIDDIIAERTGWTPGVAAIIRGIYDERLAEASKDKPDAPKTILPEDTKEAIAVMQDAEKSSAVVKALSDFNSAQKRLDHMREFGNKVKTTEDRATAIEHFGSKILNNRVSAIIQYFTRFVLQVAQQSDKSITDICNGWVDNGRFKAGQFALFERVRRQLLAEAEAAIAAAAQYEVIPESERTPEANDYIYRANEYTKIISHWDELVTLARTKLRDSMRIALGNNAQYAVDLGIDFVIEDLHFDEAESTKEHWQTKQDEISAFMSSSQAVRMLLARMPKTDAYGAVETDDLGYVVYMDPTQAHRELMDTLRGCMTSEHMRNRLAEAKESIPWMKTLYEELFGDSNISDNRLLRTQFFVDFRKSFQLYGAMEKAWKDGQIVYDTYIVNRVRNAIRGDVRARVVRGLVLDENTSLFLDGSNSENIVTFKIKDPNDKDGKKMVERRGAAINLENFRRLVNDISRKFDVKKGEESEYDSYNKSGKASFLNKTFRALGIDTDLKSVNKLLNNSHDANLIVERLIKLYKVLRSEKRFNYLLAQKNDQYIVKSVKDLKPNEMRSYIQFLEDKSFKEHFDEIARIISKYSAEQQYENSALWEDAFGNPIRLFSDVQPSYLADKMDEIIAIIKDGNMDKLREYIETEWGVSSYFKHFDPELGADRYYNRWLNDLISNGLRADGFGKNFELMKLIGESNDIDGGKLNFENFMMGKHAVAIFSEYSSLRQISNGTSHMGKFPVFILGDANVQKFITAPIYPLLSPKTFGAKEVVKVRNGAVVKETIGTPIELAPVIDGLYDVFEQERVFWKLMEDVKQSMNEERKGKPGYKEVVSYKSKSKVASKSNIFQFLTFLNADYIPANGRKDQKGKFHKQLKECIDEETGNYDKDKVKKVIERGMNDAFQKFIDNLIDTDVIEGTRAKGILDENRIGKYDTVSDIHGYFKKDIGNQGTIDEQNERLKEHLREFFWNVKFASIQQMQLFTINPAFYKDTKELQKRYKELHAPGNSLDIYAEYWDPDTKSYKRYSDGVETAAYFEDIGLNANNYNPEYAEALAYQYGLNSEDIRMRIVNGEKVEESDILEAGRNTEVYKKYAEEGKDPNTLTDGQGYRIIGSYRKVMGMSGQWNKQMEGFYRELMQARDTAKKETGSKWNVSKETINAIIAKYPVVFQPIKPYMYGIERYKFDNDIALIPVQHKYSEAVLIPELLPENSKLREMAIWMEDHVDKDNKAQPIDLLASNFIVKTGEWGTVDISGKMNKLNAETNVMEMDLNNTLNRAAVHKFRYQDYRIQTNVPDHSNTERLFGTQLRKLIMANLNMSSDKYAAYFHGRKTINLGNGEETTLDGKGLLSFYNSLIVSNILDSFEEFADEINDSEKLAAILTQTIINNSRFSMNCIDAFAMTQDEKFMLPLFEAAFEHDTASMIFSIFKNRVNRQKIRGGSMVQVSALGINSIEADNKNEWANDFGGLKDRVSRWNKHNVIYSEIAVPFNYIVNEKTDRGYVERRLDNKDYERFVDENGIPRLSDRDLDEDLINLEKKKDSMSEEEYNKQESELKELIDLCQSFVGENGHVYLPLIEQVYPGALTRIAYRIPTENDYSMVMGRVVRFTSPVAGGTMMVPAHGSTRSGWDFDIDKLYFMMFEYITNGYDVTKIDEHITKNFRDANPHLREEKLRNSYVWSRIYEKDPELKRTLGLHKARITERLNQAESALNSRYGIESNTTGFTPIDDLENITGLKAEDYGSLSEFLDAAEVLNKEEHFDNFDDYLFMAKKFLEKQSITKEQRMEFFKDFFKDSPDAGDILDLIKDHVTDRGIDYNGIKELYKYWNFIPNMEGTAAEAFAEEVVDIVKTPELDTYDFDKSPLENSRAARNNMLLNIIQHRLMDEETFMARNTPSEFTGASKGARSIRELTLGDYDKFLKKDSSGNYYIDEDAFEEAVNDEENDPDPNYDPTDPWTIVVYNAQNQLASKLIGIMANQNANHALATLMKKLELNTNIEFCGHSVSKDGIGRDLLHSNLADMKLADGRSVLDIAPLRAEDIRKNVAEYLAASVDAVKDPVLNFLVLNTLTAAPGMLLARLGYSAEEIGLFFNQPIIKEICNAYFNAGHRSADTVIASVISKYSNAKSDREANPETDFSTDNLRLNILKQRMAVEKGETLLKSEEGNSFTDSQLKIADLFLQIVKGSAELNSFITATKFTAANAVGTTPGAFYNQQERVAKYVRDIELAEAAKAKNEDGGPTRMLSMELSDNVVTPVQTESSLIDTFFKQNKSERAAAKQEYINSILNNPFAYEQAMFDANRKCLELINKYYPYNTDQYKALRLRGHSLMSTGIMRADEIDSVHQEWIAYLLSQQDNSIFNGGMPHYTSYGDEVTTREYYCHYFAEDLAVELDKPENKAIKDLPIFQNMLFDVDDNGFWNMRILGGTNRADYSRDEIIESWSDLAKMTHGEAALDGMELAKDLFMYCFYNHGFKYGYANFMFMCPTNVKRSIMVTDDMSYVDFLYAVKDGKIGANINEFYKLYIANHSADYRWVYRPWGSAKKSLISYLTKGINPQFGSTESGDIILRNPKTFNEVTSFTLDLNSFDNNADKDEFLRKDDTIPKNQFAFVPAIMIEDKLYIADNGANFNVTTDGQPVMKYRLYEPLGEYGERMMYFSPNEVTSTGWKHESKQNPEQTGGRVSVEIELDDQAIEDMSNYDAINAYVDAVAKVYQAERGDTFTGQLDIWKTIVAKNVKEEDIKQMIKDIRDKKCEIQDKDGLWVRPC